MNIHQQANSPGVPEIPESGGIESNSEEDTEDEFIPESSANEGMESTRGERQARVIGGVENIDEDPYRRGLFSPDEQFREGLLLE